jgi:hypothetical protein
MSIAAVCVATICVASIPSISSFAPITSYRCQYLVNLLFARRIFLASIACSIQDAVEHQEGMIDLGGAEGGHETGVQRVVIYMERFAGLRYDLSSAACYAACLSGGSPISGSASSAGGRGHRM